MKNKLISFFNLIISPFKGKPKICCLCKKPIERNQRYITIGHYKLDDDIVAHWDCEEMKKAVLKKRIQHNDKKAE